MVCGDVVSGVGPLRVADGGGNGEQDGGCPAGAGVDFHGESLSNNIVDKEWMRRVSRRSCRGQKKRHERCYVRAGRPVTQLAASGLWETRTTHQVRYLHSTIDSEKGKY